MISIFKTFAFVFSFQSVLCLSMRNGDIIVNHNGIAAAPDDCDPSIIPVMANFDMKKFSGKWFELAKTVTGYIDVADGVWLIEGNNISHNFLFSGRDNNQHCIRPIKGTLSAAKEPPGLLTLRYKTYSTHVEETVRVLFTDYTSVAVIYTCMHHVHTDKEMCHSAGLFGAVWTRQPHVGVEVFDSAANFLEMACIHKSSLIVRNIIGPCRVDHWDFRIDDFPAPDYCYQIMDLGSCRGYLQRYYYDAKEKACKQFTYGGCGGNNNNFMSLSECQKKCATTSKDPVCMLTAKCALHCSPCCTEDSNGCVQCDCEHIIEDNFLNCVSSSSQCPDECDAENLYQGCYVCKCGGINQLEDELGICNEAIKVGNCKDSIERYYYNVVDEQCEKFIYSGCNGNNNNFQTLQECRESCVRKISDSVIEHGPLEDPEDNSVQTLHGISSLLITTTIIWINIHFINFLQ